MINFHFLKKPFFFIIGFYYLFFIGLVANLLTSLNYIIYKETTSWFFFVALYFVIFLAVFYLLNDVFLDKYINRHIIKFTSFLGSKIVSTLEFAMENMPFFVVNLIWFYISFFLIHSSMVYYNDISIGFEYIYQLLNIVRILVVVPCFIVFYCSVGTPSFHMEKAAFEIPTKAIKELARKAVHLIHQNPKVGGTIGVPGAGYATAVAHKGNVEAAMQSTLEDAKIDLNNPEHQLQYLTDVTFNELWKEVQRISIVNKTTAVGMSMEDFKRFVTGEPSIVKEFNRAVADLKAQKLNVLLAQQHSIRAQDRVPTGTKVSDSAEIPSPHSCLENVYFIDWF
jgi:hypothetical protein